VEEPEIARALGALILLNGLLALLQLLSAPVAAAYFRAPEIENLLRVQSLLYLVTPFIAVPNAILSRRMDFRSQAVVNLAAAIAAAGTAFAGALLGWGVWTLVLAPLVLFYVRGIGLVLVTRLRVRPNFKLAGSGTMLRFGGAQLVTQLFWFAQSQSDIFIGGRLLEPRELGVYTTALFLTQIFVGKFVPPLNEIAFSAYSRMEPDGEAIPRAFLRTVQMIMLVTLPFYFGLAVTAEPIVATMIGPKWRDAVPLVTVLALAMPFLTLQILHAPATNALGRPGIAARTALAGALIMPVAFLAGSRFGAQGLAFGWLIGMPLLTLVTARASLPVIGVAPGALLRTILPPFFCAAAMAAVVAVADQLLPVVDAPVRLAFLTALGACAYALLLRLTAYPLLKDAWALVAARKP
jgi:O-antigen/teichoic acid export membrane protein